MSFPNENAVIKVFGVGGGGGNAVQHMVSNGVEGVEFYYVNTDAQALDGLPENAKIQIGSEITRGLGAGAKPEVGAQAALESRDVICKALQGADMVFVTAGMGGGTGTGAAPVVAELAREMGILTVGVVTTPFSFEGRKRMNSASGGIAELRTSVDSLITIPNDRLQSVLGNKISLLEAFGVANDVLYNAVQGISDLIVRPGMINVDFADVRTVMSEMGVSMMGTGVGKGDTRAEVAATAAISSPLLENVQLSHARGILINITAGHDLGLGEFSEIGNMIEEIASEEATVVVGTVIDPNMEGELRVTIVATGLEPSDNVQMPQPVRAQRPQAGYPHSSPAQQTVATAQHIRTRQPERPTQHVNQQNREYHSPHAHSRQHYEPPHQTQHHQGRSNVAEDIHHEPEHAPVEQNINTYTQRPALRQKQPERPAQPNQLRGINGNGESNEQDMEFLDIPAFLRRQVD